jgi:RNA polymerase sigma factor (sigma-70 family)
MSDAPDRLAELIALLATNRLSTFEAEELDVLIHQAVYPMCRRMLGDADAAADAEQEVWRRLLEHVRRPDRATAPIVNGTAYVRQIARNVCNDLGRRRGERREVPAGEQLDERFHPAADPGHGDDRTITPPRTPHDETLGAEHGYRSRMVLDHLAALSDQERRVLCLRMEGYPYAEIAARLGEGLTTSNAQTQGERAIHHLRGRAHVQVWLGEPVGAWAMPRCPQLAQLKAEVQRLLGTGKTVTVTMYRDIGRHLDPSPNRRAGSTDDPACPRCRGERDRSAYLYWLLIGALPPLIAAPAATPPPMEPVAHTQPARKRVRRPRARARTAVVATVAAVVVVAAAVAAVAVVPPLLNRNRERPPGTAAGANTGPGGLRRPCALLTDEEVNRITGTPFQPCTETALDVAGAPKLFGSDFDVLYEGKGCTNGDWRRDTDSAVLQTCRYEKPAEAFQAGVKLLRDFLAGTSPATHGTVPGLGDESFTTVWQLVASQPPLVSVFVRKGTVLYSITFLYPGAALDPAVTLARLVAERLP